MSVMSILTILSVRRTKNCVTFRIVNGQNGPERVMTVQSGSRGSESKPFKVQLIAELPVVRIDADASWMKADATDAMFSS
jgi:hypothetical protein